jgi:hypothetical protein
MDIWKRLEAWYSKKGISTHAFLDGYSTEMYRDNLMIDFSERMLDKEEELISLSDREIKVMLLDKICKDLGYTYNI